MNEPYREDLHHREWVIRIFPSRQPTIRLIGDLLIELDDKWRNGQRLFLDLPAYPGMAPAGSPAIRL